MIRPRNYPTLAFHNSGQNQKVHSAQKPFQQHVELSRKDRGNKYQAAKGKRIPLGAPSVPRLNCTSDTKEPERTCILPSSPSAGSIAGTLMSRGGGDCFSRATADNLSLKRVRTVVLWRIGTEELQQQTSRRLTNVCSLSTTISSGGIVVSQLKTVKFIVNFL